MSDIDAFRAEVRYIAGELRRMADKIELMAEDTPPVRTHTDYGDIHDYEAVASSVAGIILRVPVHHDIYLLPLRAHDAMAESRREVESRRQAAWDAAINCDEK